MTIDLSDLNFDFGAEDLEMQGGGDYVCMKGTYTAELQTGAKVAENKSGKIIEVPFSDFATEDGEGYEEGTGGIAGRKVNWTAWVEFNGEDHRQSAVKGLTSLCRALGIAEEVDGKYRLPATDLDEVLELIDGMKGSRVKVEMSPRKGAQKDDGTFFMNERIFQVLPLE